MVVYIKIHNGSVIERKADMKKQSSIIKNNLYILKIIWKIKPGQILGSFAVCAIGYTSWVFYSITFIKFIISAIKDVVDFKEIFWFILLSTIFFCSCGLLEKWYSINYSQRANVKIFAEINTMLFDKVSKVELECYEDTNFYNQYTLAMKDIETRIKIVLDSITNVVFATIASIGVLVNMYQIDHFVVFFVISPLIGNFIIGKYFNSIVFKRSTESVPHQRKMDYVSRTLYLTNYAKEMRMSNIFNVLQQMYQSGFEGVISIIKKYQGKAMMAGFWQNIFTFFIIYQGVLIYSLYRTMISHTISLGEFAVLSSAMVTAAWILIRLSENTINLINNSNYIANMKSFLEYEPTIRENQDGKKKEGEFECIELNDVSFTYKNQVNPSLNHVSMKIHKNEKIAIVGQNGAGKTSFIKLLMRLYDPSSGTILLNGTNIKEYNLKEYRDLYATAFQDYQVFSMSVSENVLMRKLIGEEDYKIVEECLKRSDIYEKVMSLPNGMDTILTKEFAEDGVMLSGGELQKIAIARVYAKQYEIAIFDEPSSALDPVAECKMYQSMMGTCKNKTVIFISHRLSTAVLSDHIYMFEHGEIVEHGTHKELMNHNGKYAEMFNKQAERYMTNELSEVKTSEE